MKRIANCCSPGELVTISVSQTVVRNSFLRKMVNSPGARVSALSISTIASIGGAPPKVSFGAKVKIR